jgi:hypothetical protein
MPIKTTFPFIQPSNRIEPSATIPAGSSVIVFQVGTIYVMQVAVWE